MTEFAVPRLIASETVYRGRVFAVEVDTLFTDDGVETRREVIRHPGAVCMVPVDSDGNILMVTQYRHAAGRRLLELPAGTLEIGEEPLTTAGRELQEEVGMRASSITPMGGFFVAPGYTSEYIHLYICEGLEPSRLPGDEDEDIEVECHAPDAVLAMIEDGTICDAKSVIGVLRWIRSINQPT